MSDRACVLRSWRLAVRHVDDLPAALVEGLNAPDALLANGTLLKDGDRCTVVRLKAGGSCWIMKRYNRKGALHTAVHTVLRSRAAWCWHNARRLRSAGLSAGEAVAYVERRLGPLRLESWLLTRFVEGPTLLEYATDPATSPAALHRAAESFAAIWRGLAALRAGHDDMKATNFIVDGEQRVWMIDLDGLRIGMPAPLYRRQRRADWQRFMRNWQGHPEVAETFRALIDTP